MRMMFMMSGGVESTGLIKHYLETTSHEIYVHYISHNNSEGRKEYEDFAVAALIPLLQKIRPFNFDRSRLDLLSGRGLGWDYQVLYPIAMVAMRHHKCVQLHRGLCLEDNWVLRDGVIKKSTLAVDRSIHYALRKAVGHMLYEGETLDTVVPMLPEYTWAKAKYWAVLDDLAPLTWSCRKPRNGNACGKCRSCMDRAAAAEGRSHVAEIDEGYKEWLRTLDPEERSRFYTGDFT